MSEPKQIFVIVGATGQFEDSREWSVCAYLKESKAIEKIKELREAYIAALDGKDAETAYQNYGNTVLKKMHEYDKSFCFDYTGTTYSYYELDLYE